MLTDLHSVYTFDHFLGVSQLVGRNFFPAIVPPPLPVVEKDLAESVAAVLRRGMEQRDSRRSKGGDDQHPLASVSEPAIIADRVFGLLSMVQRW
jgi:hypothetical protein